MAGLLKSVKNFFKEVLRREKPQELKPESETKEERNPFYRPLKVKATHTTTFFSELETKWRKQNRKRNKVARFSRRLNRQYA
jgi:hypothetical protein